METRGFIYLQGNSRPLTRGEVGMCLLEIRSVANNELSGLKLSRWENQELSRYSAEFLPPDLIRNDEFTTCISRLKYRLWEEIPLYKDGINLYSLNIGKTEFNINPILYWDAVQDSAGETIIRRTNGLYVNGQLSQKVGFYFNFQDNMETGRGPYYPGSYYNFEDDDRDKLYSDHAAYVTLTRGDICYYDFTRAVFSFQTGNLLLNFGRGDNCWGSGRLGNLLLSNNSPPFDFLSMRYDITAFLRFVYLTGILHPYPEIYKINEITASGRERKIIENKYIAAHRLEFYPCKGVEIGLSESVIYGERGLEPAYLNPINLYFSAEHNLGDMDNVAWSGDIEFNLIKGVTLYGEIFIDDMQTGKLGTDYIGNKFAYIGGCFLTNPGELKDLDLTLEYARLDPFLYTHFFPINTYKNWNSGLGHFMPPNSQGLWIKTQWHPHYCWTAEASFSITQHGAYSEELNSGGDIDIPPDEGPIQTYLPFLSGDKMEIRIYELGIRWEPLEYYTLSAKWRWHDWSGGYQNEWQITTGINVW